MTFTPAANWSDQLALLNGGQKRVNTEGTESAEENRGRESLEEFKAFWLFQLFHHLQSFSFLLSVSSVSLCFTFFSSPIND